MPHLLVAVLYTLAWPGGAALDSTTGILMNGVQGVRWLSSATLFTTLISSLVGYISSVKNTATMRELFLLAPERYLRKNRVTWAGLGSGLG